MKEQITRTTFASDTRMTPDILGIIAKIANESLTTVKQREEASLKYYKALEKVEKLDQQRPAKKKKR